MQSWMAAGMLANSRKISRILARCLQHCGDLEGDKECDFLLRAILVSLETEEIGCVNIINDMWQIPR